MKNFLVIIFAMTIPFALGIWFQRNYRVNAPIPKIDSKIATPSITAPPMDSYDTVSIMAIELGWNARDKGLSLKEALELYQPKSHQP